MNMICLEVMWYILIPLHTALHQVPIAIHIPIPVPHQVQAAIHGHIPALPGAMMIMTLQAGDMF